MISEQRAREIDHYFLQDSRARLRTMIVSSIVGTLAFLLFFWLGGGQATAAAVSFASIVLSFVTEIVRYKTPVGVREPAARRQEIVKLVPAIERRWVLARISLIAASIVAFMILRPRSTEGEVVGRRLLALKKQGRLSDARDLYKRAVVKAGIALDPSIASQLAVTAPLNGRGEGSSQAEVSAVVQRGQRLLLNLGNGETVSILVPVLGISIGNYLLGSSIQAPGVSIFGDGPDKTTLNFVPKSQQNSGQSQEQIALFQFTAYRSPVDTMFYGLSAITPAHASEEVIEFLGLTDAPYKVAAVNCRLTNFAQLLDLVTWVDVTFIACEIACGGRRFDLENVRFLDCSFSFPDDFPLDIANRLRSASGHAVFARYRQ